MKKHLKCLLVVLISVLTIFMLVSCSSNTESDTNKTSTHKRGDTVTLNVYNWGEYIELATNDAFEEYFNEFLSDKYGGIKVKVNYTTYATNEDMYSKLKNSAVVYDIVVPSDYMIEKMIEEDMLLAFDATTIENFENINESFRNNPYYDPENLYSVPYTYGMMGVIYNTDMVDEEDIGSWGLMWNEKYAGKILQFNNPRDAFATAMYYKNLDINSSDKSVWDAALEILKEQKPILQGYVNDEIFNKMTSASAAIAPYFVGDYITMADQLESLAFYYPTEGVNYFVDAMCIPKNANEPEIAKEYINFMLMEDPAVENALYIGYASPNTLVANSEYYKEEMGEFAIELLYNTTPDVVNAEYNEKYGTSCYKNFTPEIQSRVNTLWENLKIENSTETWVHVTAILIVASVIVLAVYSTYIKKKRSRDYRFRDKEARKNKTA